MKAYICNERAERSPVLTRMRFYEERPRNLVFLLKNRFDWMNNFIDSSSCGIEIGCGSGLSKQFIMANKYLLTDYTEADWLDVKNVDALNVPFDSGRFDFVIASHCIHHLSSPVKFLKEMHRILKPNGLLIINEVKNSFFMRLVLRLTSHEGYDYNIDVFDENIAAKDNISDLWAANCAIPDLLFDDCSVFENRVSCFKVLHQKYCEFFVLLNSGGVDRKVFSFPLPVILLKFLLKTDNFLIALFPNLFALSRQVVLQKNN